ncbi:energy-coupling factor transporter transmembrane component T [Sporosarcina thermotolerans]|uniref:Energy-coupling factor transporter transmembrane component T n=1 Tax=Sporosarcina thermotolerans TaxID=633404 RepID=A0AAW9AAY5_9BACL|nr:energy-coupling factor transporter transmembrane component T [Sporosarcina thermotolerans]MDW0117773.1 energy-coupling factor transporter transmembrane component T [Sporosarcina thermotolerans]WHT49142.1 energy-coupling factor transporter transmembrane component T [Sporosarcina thermotolerans]
MELTDKIKDVLNVQTIKLELIKTAFGKPDVYMAKIDPRVLMFWYLTVSILPWFTFNNTILLLIIAYTTFLAVISRVSPLILTLLGIGIITELFTLFIVSLIFGGGTFETILPLLTFSMKLFIMSIASVSVFASMSPERLSDGLLSLKVPAQFSFAVSYGYRMLPILLDEYHQIFQSFRLRGKTPEKHGFLKWRIVYYYIKVVIQSFYPLMLNIAKRTRLTVEALEVRGFSYSLHSSVAKKNKLSYLKVRTKDYIFIITQLTILLLILWAGDVFPT